MKTSRIVAPIVLAFSLSFSAAAKSQNVPDAKHNLQNLAVAAYAFATCQQAGPDKIIDSPDTWNNFSILVPVDREFSKITDFKSAHQLLKTKIKELGKDKVGEEIFLGILASRPVGDSILYQEKSNSCEPISDDSMSKNEIKEYYQKLMEEYYESIVGRILERLKLEMPRTMSFGPN